MKKRVSNRRVLPGGVIALANSRMADRSGRWPVSRKVRQVDERLAGRSSTFCPMMMPTSSKVSRMAAMARPRARAGVAVPRILAISLSRTRGSRSAIGSTRQSAGSTRPPGNTNLLGMKAWEAWRLPISTRGLAVPSRRMMMRVAASRGRSAVRPASGGFNLVALGTALSGQRSIFEAVHAQRPLESDDGALDARQGDQREKERQRHPQACMENEGRVPEVLDDERQRKHDMAHQEQREIGRRIIGAVMIELLTAMAAAL